MTMRRIRCLAMFGVLLFASVPAVAAAQETVTITGHVSSSSMPVRSASVRILELDLGATTDADGRYSFIVPSSRVRGQTVTITARYLRLRPASAQIALTGGAMVQDFDLTAGEDTPTKRPTPRPADSAPATRPGRAPAQPATGAPRAAGSPAAATSVPASTRDARAGFTLPSPVLDGTTFTDVAGLTNFGSALTGRVAGLEVRSASTIGGSTSLLRRGAHTIAGISQPLVVVNGIVMDNSNITTAAQQAGLGGFDYGSAINDLNLEDIASVELLRGPVATMRYGGRAANGVLIVTTRNGRGLNGFDVAASQQISSETPLRLPQYQNAYGQGLGGKFAFFDGKGGGLNDATDQSWGPLLDGQLVSQASLTEAARPDVRGWFARPTNVSDYFARGRTSATNFSVQAANETGQLRFSLSDRRAKGLTPQSEVTRRSALFTSSMQPLERLSVTGDAQYYTGSGNDRPGTGFDESNPVSVFSHMGRQIDVAALKTRQRDLLKNQISWNYAGHNNPYFAALENDNHDDRSRLLGGVSATYALSSWVTGTVRAGSDRTSDRRNFTVASGWMGGFPYYAGRGDFSTGGFQTDDISATQTTMDVTLRAAPRVSGPTAFALTAGAGRRSDGLQVTTRGTDTLADTARAAPLNFTGGAATNFVIGGAEALLRDYASLGVSVRAEVSSLQSGSSNTEIYPAVMGSIDFARLDSGARRRRTFETLAIHGGWSRSGSDATSALVQRVGLTSTSAPAALAQISPPEITAGWEIGGTARMYGNRVGLDVTYYNERSELLTFASGTTLNRSGVVSNKGIDATVALVPLRAASGLEWSVGLTFGKNTNLVESLSSSVSAVNLAPTFGGVSVQARTGSSIGTLVGTKFLRDASGALLLRNGRPLPDSVRGPQVLGESTPSWIGGLSTGLRYRGIDVSVLFDTHRGGRIFSASNMTGAYSGVLDETAFRPDTGLLILGIDVATNGQNTKHVTTEDYYHALGAIGERWLYDASFVKLREARASFSLPLTFSSALHAQSLRGSIIARNLALWSSAPNIDPETVLSTAVFRGSEMGQLPSTKSIGFQITLTP